MEPLMCVTPSSLQVPLSEPLGWAHKEALGLGRQGTGARQAANHPPSTYAVPPLVPAHGTVRFDKTPHHKNIFKDI
jgi:hypothetical protein